MKKLYTLFAALTISAMAFSQRYDWNISNAEFNALGKLTETTIINGLTIYAASDKAVEIDDKGPKNYDEVGYPYRLKLGGTGAFDKNTGLPTNRVLSFDVEGSGTITVLAMSSSNDADRELAISAGSKDNVLGIAPALGTSLTSTSIEYTGDATTIYLYSKSSGINLYRIIFTPSTSTAVKPPVTANANVVSVEYYNIGGLSLGNKFEVLPGGIYVEITKYDNGTVTSKKIVKRNN